MLGLALHQIGAEADEAAGDTTGYNILAVGGGPLLPAIAATVQVAAAIEQVRSILAQAGIPWTPLSQGPGR